jgi:hypothetical protein
MTRGIIQNSAILRTTGWCQMLGCPRTPEQGRCLLWLARGSRSSVQVSQPVFEIYLYGKADGLPSPFRSVRLRRESRFRTVPWDMPSFRAAAS